MHITTINEKRCHERVRRGIWRVWKEEMERDHDIIILQSEKRKEEKN